MADRHLVVCGPGQPLPVPPAWRGARALRLDVKTFDYGDDWRRKLRFDIPVRRPDMWRRPDVRAALAECLCDLMDDQTFEFGFRPGVNLPSLGKYLYDTVDPAGKLDCDEVVLFSGGLDSLGGALQEVVHGRRRSSSATSRSARWPTANGTSLPASAVWSSMGSVGPGTSRSR